MSTTKSSLPLLRYALSEQVVAFSTTREGGQSTGAYASMNVNPYCGDDPVAVEANRQRLATELHLPAERIVLPHQVHGTEVRIIAEDFLKAPLEHRQHLLEGVDAVLTNVPNLCIGVSTADCIPILLYDSVHQAVAAIHAGWRGTVARIVQKAVQAMAENYQSRPEDIAAQIGPGISLRSFEVGEEVYEAFRDAGFPMSQIALRLKKWHINLPEANRWLLTEAGLRPENIADCAICTYNEHRHYFSARRLGIHSGRIYTGIFIK